MGLDLLGVEDRLLLVLALSLGDAVDSHIFGSILHIIGR
jgi:hypothetical protein